MVAKKVRILKESPAETKVKNAVQSILAKFSIKIDDRTLLLFLLVLFLVSFFFFFPTKSSSSDPSVVKIFKQDGEPLVEIYEDNN